jgi:hypothetical protein
VREHERDHRGRGAEPGEDEHQAAAAAAFGDIDPPAGLTVSLSFARRASKRGHLSRAKVA